MNGVFQNRTVTSALRLVVMGVLSGDAVQVYVTDEVFLCSKKVGSDS